MVAGVQRMSAARKSEQEEDVDPSLCLCDKIQHVVSNEDFSEHLLSSFSRSEGAKGLE